MMKNSSRFLLVALIASSTILSGCKHSGGPGCRLTGSACCRGDDCDSIAASCTPGYKPVFRCTKECKVELANCVAEK